MLAAWALPAGAQTNLGTFSIGQVEFYLDGPHVWAADPGSALPPGLSIRSDLPPWFPPSATGGLIGIATTPNTYFFNILRDGIAVPYTLTITSFTQLDYWTLPDAFVGVPYSYQFSALNNAGVVSWTPNGPLPAGLTLSSSGLLSGTPTASGFFSVNANLNDGTDTVFKGVSLSVYSVRITTPGALPNATQNAPYSASVSASGGSGTFSYFGSGLPSGLSIDSNGNMTGTPTNVGAWVFDVTATDNLSVSYTKRMSITTIGVPPRLPNVQPFSNDFDGDCSLGVPCSKGANAGSGGRSPFTWSASGLPPGMSLRFGEGNASYWIADSQVQISGTPMALGTYSVTLTVTDADGVTATNTFPLSVKALWQTNNLSNGSIDQAYSQTLRVIGGTLPYTGEIVGGHLPAGLIFNPSTMTVSGTPTENGWFNVLVRYTDAVGNTYETRNYFFIGSLTSTITINTGDDLGFFVEGSSNSRTLSACCVPSYFWSLVGGALPAGVSLSSNGVISGTPGAGSSGMYLPLIRVDDAANSANYAVRQFTLRVTTVSFSGSNTLPTGNVGTPYNTSIAASGGSGITITLEPAQYLPPGVSLSSGGTLSGTPTAAGQFTFNVRATNSGGLFNTRSYSISIYPAGVNPPLSLSFGPTFSNSTIGVRSAQISAATGGTPSYTYSLTPAVAQAPGIRVQNGQPLPTNFPGSLPAGYLGVTVTPGSYTGSVRVTDSATNTLDRSISFLVVPQHLLSNSNLPKATISTPYSSTLTPYGASGYGWSASGLPAGLTIDAFGQISGTPTVFGSFSPSITLTDLATSTPVTIGFSLTVNPYAIATGGTLLSGTAGTPYSQTLSAPGCGSGCTWNVISGSLPSGLSLSSSGNITGNPNGTSTSSFTAQVAGSNGTVSKVFALRVASSSPQALAFTFSTINDQTIGSNAQVSLFAQGGTLPYTWTLDSGTLPAGVSIQGPGETIGANLTPGMTYLAGRAMELGVFNFTLRVTDFVGATTTRAFTWRISPLSNQYSNLPLSGSTLIYNLSYTQPLLVIGGLGSYTWSSVGMPLGLSLNSSAGVISGTPGVTGSFTVLVTATDSATNTITASVNLNIAGAASGPTLSFNSGPSFTSQQGVSGSFAINTSGGTGAHTLTALTSLPPGFALVGSNLVGFATTAGIHNFTIMATDTVGNIGVRAFTLTVAPFGFFSNTSALPDATSGVPYSYSLSTVGAAATWAISTGSLPAGLSLSPAGLISGTTSATGSSSFSVTATSGAAIVLNLTLRVSTTTFDPPSTLPTAIIGEPYSYTFTATGPGTKTWSVNSLPSGMNFNSATGEVNGRPTATGGFVQSILVTVTTAGTQQVQRRVALPVSFPIPNVLDIAVANTALADLMLGQQGFFTLGATGGVAPFTWSVAPASTLPPGMALYSGSVLSPAGGQGFAPGSTVLGGIPTAAGTFSFDLIATDAVGDTARRTYTLKVATIGLTSLTVPNATVNVPYSPILLPNGSTGPLQFTGVGGTAPYTMTLTPTGPNQDMLPPGLTMSSGGLFSGTPTSTGAYRFVMRLQDALGETYTRTFLLNVNNANGVQISNTNPFLSPGRGVSIVLNAVSNSGFFNYSWSLQSGTLPPGLSLTTDSDIAGTSNGGNTTALAGQATTPGTYTYTLRATVIGGNPANFADHFFTATVARIRPATLTPGGLVNLPAGHVGEPYTFALTMAGGVPPYSFAPDSLPAGFSLSPTGVITGTPVSIGNHLILASVTDSALNTVPFSIPIVVTDPGVPSPLLPGTLVAQLEGTLVPGSVSVPYLFQLDSLVRGGVAPFSWALTGGSLPAGIELLPGGSGVSAYLSGRPQTTGESQLTLTVTDNAGQSLTFDFDFFVPTVAFSATSAPAGRVGVPYSVPLGPLGGTPPYTLLAYPLFDLPPGLTLSASGVLAGVPSFPGTFQVAAIIIDSFDNFTFKLFRVTIDDAAGEVPAVTLGPNPIELYYELGSAPLAPVPVQVYSSSGTHPFALNLAGAPWATLTVASGTAPSAVNLNIAAGLLAPGTYVGLLGVSAPDSANLSDAAPIVLTVSSPPPCTYSVNPASGSVLAAGGSGGFTVSAGNNCAWSASTTDPWITVSSNGTGNGNVSYSAAANPGIARTGTIAVGGAIYALTQFGADCTFAISPLVIGAPASGGSASIGITASPACAGPPITGWTAIGLSAAPPNGVGDASVIVTVPVNPDPASRVLIATIGGQALTVNQAGAACNVSLSAAVASLGSAGGFGSVDVSTLAGCHYDTVLGPSWINVTSGASGDGPGTLVYSAAPNSTTFARSGLLLISGQPFEITQEPLPCSATLDTAGLGSPYGPSGGVGSVGITMNGSNCSWSASSGAGWASVTPFSGTGSGQVIVSVGSNAASTIARPANLTIAGQTIELSQAGTTCTYALTSAAASVPASGAAGSVGVAAPAVCAWSATTSDPAWLTVASAGSAGSASVNFVAQPNPDASPRTGMLTIAGLTYSVNQAAAPCAYTLSEASTTLVSTGAGGSLTFSTGAVGCAPTVVSYSSWLHQTSSFGGASGTVDYAADANPSGSNRIGTIQVGDKTFRVTQLGSACAFSLNNYGAYFSSAGATGQVLLGSQSAVGCTLVVGVDLPTIVTLGSLTGPESNIYTQIYNVLGFGDSLTPVIRRARITFGGTVFVVKQSSW